MKALRRLLRHWTSLVKSAWRAFVIFASLGVVALAIHYLNGGFEGQTFAETAQDTAILFGLLFVAAFVTSIIFHYQGWRNSRWPGGGGPRKQ